MTTYSDSDIISAGFSYQELVSANITPNFADDSVYIQRKLRAQFNIPLIRNGVENPYTQFTKEQLDMRRKMEVLKYDTGSKKGKLTKKDKWAQLVRGNYNTNRMSIPADARVSLSSITAGIPGDPIQMVENTQVPLYGFKSNNSAPGTGTEYVQDVPDWSVSYDINRICFPLLAQNTTKLSTLYIRPSIKSPYYTYRYTTPMVANIQGVYLPIDTSGSIITATVSPLVFKVYYNESQVQNNINMVSSLTNNTVQIKLTPQVDTTDPTIETYNFSANIKVGDLIANNVFLYTSPNYVYTFRLSYNVDINITGSNSAMSSANIEKRIQYRLISNSDTASSSLNQVNCVFLTNEVPSANGNSLISI